MPVVRQKSEKNELPLLSEGTVKHFDDGTGNGCIEREGEPDVFVNREAIKSDGPRMLFKGDRVRLEVMEGPNGPRAVNVRKY